MKMAFNGKLNENFETLLQQHQGKPVCTIRIANKEGEVWQEFVAYTPEAHAALETRIAGLERSVKEKDDLLNAKAKCKFCNVPVLEEGGLCPGCAYEHTTFMDRIIQIAKNHGKNSWGESPSEMITEIISEYHDVLQALVDEFRLADLYHLDNEIKARVKALGIEVKR